EKRYVVCGAPTFLWRQFIKIKEPEGYGQKKKKGSSKVQKTGLEKENKEIKKDPKAQDIRS
ncbi:Hypothetical protein FKW44_023227, partial [Caligus rogercresseyi]